MSEFEAIWVELAKDRIGIWWRLVDFASICILSDEEGFYLALRIARRVQGTCIGGMEGIRSSLIPNRGRYYAMKNISRLSEKIHV